MAKVIPKLIGQTIGVNNVQEGFRIEASQDGEIVLPGDPVPEGTRLLAPMTDVELDELVAEHEADIEASRPSPEDLSSRFAT